jgi:hypothetical protein
MMEYVRKKWSNSNGDFNSFIISCRKELAECIEDLITDIKNKANSVERKNQDLDDAFGFTEKYVEKNKRYKLDLFDNIVERR